MASTALRTAGRCGKVCSTSQTTGPPPAPSAPTTAYRTTSIPFTPSSRSVNAGWRTSTQLPSDSWTVDGTYSHGLPHTIDLHTFLCTFAHIHTPFACYYYLYVEDNLQSTSWLFLFALFFYFYLFFLYYFHTIFLKKKVCSGIYRWQQCENFAVLGTFFSYTYNNKLKSGSEVCC